jgi:hypothetical protein
MEVWRPNWNRGRGRGGEGLAFWGGSRADVRYWWRSCLRLDVLDGAVLTPEQRAAAQLGVLFFSARHGTVGDGPARRPVWLAGPKTARFVWFFFPVLLFLT